NRLNDDGILVVSSSGSLSYMGDELRDLNNCILNTLKAVYPYILIIPGDCKNLFLASSSEAITTIDHNLLVDRLVQRNISTNLVTPGYITYKLEPRWLDFFMTSIEDATEKINRDFRPIGVYYGYSYWNALFSPSLRKICGWFEKVNISMILIVTIAFILLFLLLSHVFPGITRACVPFAVASTGFAGMVFNLALIFAFQTLYGYVYYQIGILVTTFMVGAAAGSAFMTSRLERIRKDFAVLLGTEMAIITLSGLLTLIFLLFDSRINFPDRSFLLHMVFLFLFFLIGALIGLQFPLASKIHLKSCCSLSRTAGLIYSSDLLGGWTGGIIGGVILLPVLGLVETGFLIVFVKIGSLIILYSSVKRMKFRIGI
ncbi:MAG: spermine synthase, partial [Candidatus Aegiribacteria sp.]|nr:spermine synthase [Candidatus Aegiribacteria sp.]